LLKNYNSWRGAVIKMQTNYPLLTLFWRHTLCLQDTKFNLHTCLTLGEVLVLTLLCRHASCLQDIKFNVHAHPTLSEVLDELFKGAHLEKELVAA